MVYIYNVLRFYVSIVIGCGENVKVGECFLTKKYLGLNLLRIRAVLKNVKFLLKKVLEMFL
jgi:hypothetical protein